MTTNRKLISEMLQTDFSAKRIRRIRTRGTRKENRLASLSKEIYIYIYIKERADRKLPDRNLQP